MLYHRENKWKKRLIAFYDFGVVLILFMCFISYGLKPLMNLFNLRIEIKIHCTGTKETTQELWEECAMSIVDLNDSEGYDFEEKEEIAEVYNTNDLDEILFEEEEENEKTEELLFCSLGDEQTAKPIGGYKAYYKFISENLKYPEKAKENGIEGRVFIQFLVNKNGELKEIKTIRGIGNGCDKAAEEVIKNSKKWKPGKYMGKLTEQRIVIPINFKLK